MKCHQNGKDLEVQNAVRSKCCKHWKSRGLERKVKAGMPKEVHEDAANGGLGSLQGTICKQMPNEAVLAADCSWHGIDKRLQTAL